MRREGRCGERAEEGTRVGVWDVLIIRGIGAYHSKLRLLGWVWSRDIMVFFNELGSYIFTYLRGQDSETPVLRTTHLPSGRPVRFLNMHMLWSGGGWEELVAGGGRGRRDVEGGVHEGRFHFSVTLFLSLDDGLVSACPNPAVHFFFLDNFPAPIWSAAMKMDSGATYW